MIPLVQHYKYGDLFFYLFCFFGLAEIPGTMQAFILTAKPALQVVFPCEHKKSFFIDVIIFAFLQH
jgi:hypothetical protein